LRCGRRRRGRDRRLHLPTGERATRREVQVDGDGRDRLNQALENAGLEVVETDLGEYLMQIRGERPQHIVVPAIRLTRGDAAEALGVQPEWGS
jgi:hypothetical protein